jgi:hypothetical protein
VAFAAMRVNLALILQDNVLLVMCPNTLLHSIILLEKIYPIVGVEMDIGILKILLIHIMFMNMLVLLVQLLVELAFHLPLLVLLVKESIAIVKTQIKRKIYIFSEEIYYFLLKL